MGEIVEAVKQGKKVKIFNAVIDGPLLLRSVTIKGEIIVNAGKRDGGGLLHP